MKIRCQSDNYVVKSKQFYVKKGTGHCGAKCDYFGANNKYFDEKTWICWCKNEYFDAKPDYFCVNNEYFDEKHDYFGVKNNKSYVKVKIVV